MKGLPGKAPTINWYFKDWLSDRSLQATSAATRGIWINLLMFMYDSSMDKSTSDDPGTIDCNIQELSRLAGCSLEEAESFILEGLKHKFCDILKADGSQFTLTSGGCGGGGQKVDCLENVLIVSRRIKREHETRVKWREDKRKQREAERASGGCLEDVSGTRARPSPIPIPSPRMLLKKQGFVLSDDKLKDGSMLMIEQALVGVCEALKTEGIFSNVKSFVTQALNNGSNKRAVQHALQKTYIKKTFKKGPWSYAGRILKVENGNYNELENQKTAG